MEEMIPQGNRGTPTTPDELVSTINDLFVTEAEPWWNAKRKMLIE